MKNGITGSKRTENGIYKSLELARRLQNVRFKDYAVAMGVTKGRVSQMISDKSMTVKQLCEVADLLGLEVTLCAK